MSFYDSEKLWVTRRTCRKLHCIVLVRVQLSEGAVEASLHLIPAGINEVLHDVSGSNWDQPGTAMIEY